MDDGAWRRSRRQRDDDGGTAAGTHWSSFDVGLPAVAAGLVTGALHLWLLRPPSVVRKSAAAAAGAWLGTLLVGCYVNVRRDSRIKKETSLQSERAKSWDDADRLPGYPDDLPRGPRSSRKPVGLKNIRMDDA
ncbi:hypothetical protein HPB50_027517 [Hyalomma asiaticum]|uniref:Uncharacterized protein n=1 Tax=Hyalomma asiaticum TaxID=266040 RepID=A0ACB7SRL7_HYAAI|nr:hypothetical protein HPB50_027517 [Hyalomma asiaticum]